MFKICLPNDFDEVYTCITLYTNITVYTCITVYKWIQASSHFLLKQYLLNEFVKHKISKSVEI